MGSDFTNLNGGCHGPVPLETAIRSEDAAPHSTTTARSSTFSVDASFLLLCRPVSGCYGSKMGAGCVRHEPAPAVRCPSMAVTDFSTLPRDARLLSAMSARLLVMRGGA